jgi:predicted nicotinamide N-methyase
MLHMISRALIASGRKHGVAQTRCFSVSATSISIPTLGDDDSTIELQIKQRFTLPPAGSHTKGRNDVTGLSVWSTAKPLLRRLLRNTEFSNKIKRTKHNENPVVRILELGAGCGLLGMGLAAATGGAAKVILTDHAESTGWLQQNVDLNHSSFYPDSVTVEPLSWGDPTHMNAIEAAYNHNATMSNSHEDEDSLHHFDYIVGSDLLYDPTFHAPLLETLQRFAIPNKTEIYLGYPPRSKSEERFVCDAANYFDVETEPLDHDDGKAMLAICHPR